MSEIILPLFASVSTLRLISSDGGEAQLPVLRLGDTMRCELRLYETAESEQREVWPNVRTLNAAVGRVVEAPTSGDFTLRQPGGEAFGPIARDTSAEDLTTVFNAALNLVCLTVEVAAPGCWLIRFDSDDPIELETATNRLRPDSFARWRPFQEGHVWWHELRLIQAPLAFSEDGHVRVLPPAPTLRRVRGGGDPDNLSEADVNEIQALTVPPGFTGTFVLRWNGRETKILGIQDGPEELEAALNAMWKDRKTRFAVTNPEQNNAYIEFMGPLADAPQPLIEASVKSFQPGVLTFTLSLDRAQMHAALRMVAEIEVPLEIELEVVGDGEDAADPAVAGRIITIAQQTVKVVREQIWKELAVVRALDWLRPPEPRNYIPFTQDQLLIGNQATYVAALGDGELRSFSLPHNLGTANGTIAIRQNAPNGRLLVLGDDYEIRFPSDNEIVVDFREQLAAPALNAYVFNFTAAGPASAFMAGLHITIPQVDGLEDALNALSERLSTVEDLLPTTGLSQPTKDSKPISITIPDKFEVFPGKLPASFDPKTLTGTSIPATLPRAAGLLPAIHDATIVPVAVPLPSAGTQAGEVFRNDTDAPLLVPGGLGRRSTYLEPGGFIGSDGRVWYRLTNVAETNSYFPTDFERELFLLAVNEQMLRAGQSFTLEFDIALQLLQANTRGQYLIVIELGSAPGQLTPAPTAENLFDVEWQTVPLLSQRLIVSSLQLKHHFGASISRETDGTLLANRLLYNAWEVGAAVPASANFIIRARLVQWDTENSVRGAKGNVFYGLTAAKAEIK